VGQIIEGTLRPLRFAGWLIFVSCVVADFYPRKRIASGMMRGVTSPEAPPKPANYAVSRAGTIDWKSMAISIDAIHRK